MPGAAKEICHAERNEEAPTSSSSEAKDLLFLSKRVPLPLSRGTIGKEIGSFGVATRPRREIAMVQKLLCRPKLDDKVRHLAHTVDEMGAVDIAVVGTVKGVV